MLVGTLTDLAVRMQWQIDNDPSYLPQIEVQVSRVIQDILSMSETNMPARIITDGLRRFKALYQSFGIPCRYSTCRFRETIFHSESDRDRHESTHNRSYKCPDCDFSARGFATQSSLHQHQEKYHMQPEDFQIPQRANNGSALITTPSEKDSFHRQDSDRSGFSNYASSDILYFSGRSPIDRQFPPFDQWREDLSEASMRFQEHNQKSISDSHSGHGGKNPEVSSNHERAQEEP